jgi:hypothetical protein
VVQELLDSEPMFPRRSPTALLLATLALVQAYGCGSVSSSSDGGSGAAGQAGGGQGGAASAGAGGSIAGATGTAGASGVAGSSGAAGHDGGASDVGTATCADLVDQYSQALTPARSCTTGATGQCQTAVSSSLSPCFSGCMIYVDDASTLNDSGHGGRPRAAPT